MCGVNAREPNGRDRPCSAGADREVAPAPRGPLVTEAVSRRLRELSGCGCNPATAARHRPETGRHMLPGFDYTPFAAIGREHGPASGTGRRPSAHREPGDIHPCPRPIGDAADRGRCLRGGAFAGFHGHTGRGGTGSRHSARRGPAEGLP